MICDYFPCATNLNAPCIGQGKIGQIGDCAYGLAGVLGTVSSPGIARYRLLTLAPRDCGCGSGALGGVGSGGRQEPRCGSPN